MQAFRMKVLKAIFVLCAFGIIFAGCKKEYTVTFDVGEGSGIPPSPQIFTRSSAIMLPEQGEMIAPPGTLFDGWMVNGWIFDSGDRLMTTRLRLVENKTLIARWVKEPVTITYHLNDGTSVRTITETLYEKIGEHSYKDNDTVSMPGQLSNKSGSAFVGWFSDAALTTPVKHPYLITDGITLYAKWLPAVLTIPYPLQHVSALAISLYSDDPIEPIGWSRNGLFAYRIDGSNSVIPASGYDLNIFDTVTDEYIDNKTVWTSFPDEGFEYPDDKVLAEIKQEWQEFLAKYEIIGEVQNPIAEIEDYAYFPFEEGTGYGINNNTTFYCWFEYELINSDEEWEDEIIDWKLMVEVDNKQKLVASGRESSFMLWGKQIKGYFKSPYENRIIIIGADVGHGFEGETAIRTKLYGCHLSVGFE
jgi:uncharacterized repeat protein (TIGR02543 family)